MQTCVCYNINCVEMPKYEAFLHIPHDLCSFFREYWKRVFAGWKYTKTLYISKKQAGHCLDERERTPNE